MQISIKQGELLRAVGQVAHVPARKTEIPILACLVLGASGQGGTVHATNLEIDITTPFAAEVSAAGRVAVNARILHDIIKRMPAGQDIALSVVGEQLHLVSGKARFRLAIFSADDYPTFSIAGEGGSTQFEIEAEIWRSMLAAVRHAVSKDEARHYLGGVHFHITAQKPVELRAVATNGHVLAMRRCLAPAGSEGMPAIIIPRDTVGELVKLLPESDLRVSLMVSDRFIWLDLPSGLSFGSKLIDGTYPDYARVIPQAHPHFIRIEAHSLAAAIDRVATICDADHAAIVLSMNPRGTLSVTARHKTIGSAVDRIEGFEIQGERAAIAFNYRYLATMLQLYAGGVVELRYQTAVDPVVVTMVGHDTGLQVLMPRRADETEELAEAA